MNWDLAQDYPGKGIDDFATFGKDGSVLVDANPPNSLCSLEVNSGVVTIDVADKSLASSMLSVGGNGNANLTLAGQLNAGKFSFGALNVGSGANTSGILNVAGASAIDSTPNGANIIGGAGKGRLLVEAGATVDNGADPLVIGSQLGGDGQVVVQDLLSLLSSATAITIGAAGTGEMDVSRAGRVQCGSATIGDAPWSKGTVAIQGNPAFKQNDWTVNNTLVVGNSGYGELQIENNGHVSCGSAVVGKSGPGTVTVSGSAAELTIDPFAGSLDVRNGSVTVEQGGKVTDDFQNAQADFAGTGGAVATLTVTPATTPSTFRMGALYIGGAGGPNAPKGAALMTVGGRGASGASASVQSTNSYVGPLCEADVLANGAWQNSSLAIGAVADKPAVLNVKDGGTVNTSDEATVDGIGTEVAITNGGNWEIDGELDVAGQAGDNVTVAVGSKSSLSAADTTWIGNGESSSAHVSVVGDGELITSNSDGSGGTFLGSGSQSSASVILRDQGAWLVGPDVSDHRDLDIGRLPDATDKKTVVAGLFGRETSLIARDVNVDVNGTIAGVGTVCADILNSGTLLPGDVGKAPAIGTLTVAGDYAADAPGTLGVDIASATSNDLLYVTGEATLGGTLDVWLLNDYQPKAGDRFVIVTAGTLNGNFNKLDFSRAPLAPGLMWHVDCDQEKNEVVLEVVQVVFTPFNPTEGLAFSDTVGTIIGLDGPDDAQTVYVKMHWSNDGSMEDTYVTTTASAYGQIVADGDNFDIVGNGTYPEDGPKAFSLTLTDQDGSSISVDGPVMVEDAPLTAASVTDIPATEGTKANFKVATFTDEANSGGFAYADDFAAKITWEDGTTSAGTVSWNEIAGYDVCATHEFDSAGTKTIKVDISDEGGSAAAEVTSTFDVGEPALQFTGQRIVAENDQLYSGLLGTFVDPADTSNHTTNHAPTFTAQVTYDSWYGEVTTPGTVTYNGDGYDYEVYGASGDFQTSPDCNAESITLQIFDTGSSDARQIVALAPTWDADGSNAVGTLALCDVAGDSTGASGGRYLNATAGTQIGTANVPVLLGAVNWPAGRPTDGIAADIQWGDSDPADFSGTVIVSGSTVSIYGTHTYADAGQYAVTAWVNFPPAWTGGTYYPPGCTNELYAVATVIDNQWSVTGRSGLIGTEGAPLSDPVPPGSGPEAVVAIICDTSNTLATAGQFGATITWQVDQPAGGAPVYHTTTGQIVEYNTASGIFFVEGTYTYGEDGLSAADGPIDVRINDEAGQFHEVQVPITIVDAPLTVSTALPAAEATQGLPFSGEVAAFSDADPAGLSSDYTASINWGDNATSDGVVEPDGTGGFIVYGTHTYLAAADIAATAGQTFSGEVASFSDVTGDNTLASHYSAAIDWGDGSSGSGIVAYSFAEGCYVVTGSHTYAADALPGVYPLTVTISDDGSSTEADGSAEVAPLPVVTLTVPGGQMVSANGSLAIGGISVSDADSPGSDPLTVTLEAAQGTLAVQTNITGGLTSGDISGNGTGTVVLIGTPAAINLTLDGGVAYNAVGTWAADILTVDAYDSGSEGNGDSQSAEAAVPIWVVTVGSMTSVAGNGSWGGGGDGGPAADASLNSPAGVAVDAAGNLFIADSFDNVVREVDRATGDISTVAGDGTYGYGGDGGPASGAELASPTGVAVDSAGNLFIADSGNNCIREVSGGIITTFAGGAIGGYGGDSGAATSAQLYDPQGVAVDGSGDLFIADSGNDCIREVFPNGIITTVAGGGSGGDGGPATNAALSWPTSVAVDAAGNLFIADSSNDRIREVDHSNGLISTVAGNGSWGSSGDGGAATGAEFADPKGVAVDSAGDLFIADSYNGLIREVDRATGLINTVAGNSDLGYGGYGGDSGPATSVQLNSPTGVAVDAAGRLFIADRDNCAIREVSANGIDPTVSIAASAATAAYGQGLTLTANVIPETSGPVPPTGNVAFFDGTTYLGSGALDTSGEATLTISTLAAGQHDLTAYYVGDASYVGNASGTTPVTVSTDLYWDPALANGSWNATAEWHVGSPSGPLTAWIDGNDAIFPSFSANTGINIAGPVSPNSLIFQGGSWVVFGASSLSFGPAGGTVEVDGTSTSVTIASAISGGRLTKTGTGTLVLTGDNSYTGGTVIQCGEVDVGSGTPGSIVGDVVDDGSLWIWSTENVSLSGISGSGTITQYGTGTTTISGHNSGFTGIVYVDYGTLRLGDDAALGTTPNALYIEYGTLDLNGHSITVGAFGGPGGVVTDNSSGSGTSTLTTNFSSAAGYSGTICDGATRTVAFQKSGGSWFVLSGDNTYTGGTTIDAGCEIDVGRYSPGSIVGDVVDNGSLWIWSTENLTFSGVISGAGAVDDLGSGTLTISGQNTYSGGTGIGSGATIVLVVSDGATLGSGPVWYWGGTLRLA
ncbi:MAG: Ig-like domain repeat protein [Thermoguttaceae bacterium]